MNMVEYEKYCKEAGTDESKYDRKPLTVDGMDAMDRRRHEYGDQEEK